MFVLDSLPPEIFARIFEAGILTWGIGFLAPVCLVCKAWNDIVATTPHLWGIITITKDSDSLTLQAQLSKAKASPLTVNIISNFSAISAKKSLQAVLNRVVSLSHNWVRADVSTDLLLKCRWSEMHSSLQELRLSTFGAMIGEDDFFDTDDAAFGSLSKLHCFTAHSIPSRWITHFLSPSITYLDLFFHRTESETLTDASGYFSQIPEVRVLKLTRFPHGDLASTLHPPVHLAKLTTLELNLVAHPSRILCQMSAPSLQILSIHHPGGIYDPHNNHWKTDHEPEFAPLAAFFSQWSQGDFLPLRLHTLELVECLRIDDVPYLIRWLARLPSLVRLILLDDAVGMAVELRSSSEETNILKALASPQEAGTPVKGWLCPSLMQLHLATNLSLTDLIDVARARGGITTPPYSTSPPSRLRSITAPLCPSGSQDEIEELKSLADNVRCGCLGCEFNLTSI
jgi:hypothetical protein